MDLSSTFSALSNKEKLMAVYNQNKNVCKSLKKFDKEYLDEALSKWIKGAM